MTDRESRERTVLRITNSQVYHVGCRVAAENELPAGEIVWVDDDGFVYISRADTGEQVRFDPVHHKTPRGYSGVMDKAASGAERTVNQEPHDPLRVALAGLEKRYLVALRYALSKKGLGYVPSYAEWREKLESHNRTVKEIIAALEAIVEGE